MKGMFLRRDYEKQAIRLAIQLSPHLKDRWALSTMQIDNAMIECMKEHNLKLPEGGLRRGTYIIDIIPQLEQAVNRTEH